VIQNAGEKLKGIWEHSKRKSGLSRNTFPRESGGKGLKGNRKPMKGSHIGRGEPSLWRPGGEGGKSGIVHKFGGYTS